VAINAILPILKARPMLLPTRQSIGRRKKSQPSDRRMTLHCELLGLLKGPCTARVLGGLFVLLIRTMGETCPGYRRLLWTSLRIPMAASSDPGPASSHVGYDLLYL
jgi:hypothetical protein